MEKNQEEEEERTGEERKEGVKERRGVSWGGGVTCYISLGGRYFVYKTYELSSLQYFY
jgi:hypothetical protein